MKQTVHLTRKSPMIGLATDIVYLQKAHWCNCNARQLRLSFMHPRHFYNYDAPAKATPVVVFLCGGGFQRMDPNVWMPNLVYYAERGFAVAGVEYSVQPGTSCQERLTEIKAAIRFLRSHAKEFCIDPARVGVMGESAGAYLAALTALTSGGSAIPGQSDPAQSDAVNACVLWYAPASIKQLTNNPPDICTDEYPDLTELVTEHAPPFLMLHGTADTQIPCAQSEALYNALQQQHVVSELYLVEGANHADPLFVQSEMKEIIYAFLERNLR